MYQSLDERGLSTEEQNGCSKGAPGTDDLVFIDKMILKDAKRRRKNLAMHWIDYRKAYDIVPHFSVMECPTMFEIANNVQNLVQYAMLLWKVELKSNNHNFGNIALNRGIFQGTLCRLCYS